MTDNISDKDKKDWENFITSKEKIQNKDIKFHDKKTFKTKLNSNYPDKKNRKKLIRNFIDHLLNPRKKCFNL